MTAVLTCCGFPMAWREVFGVRVFSCVYRHHDRLYVKDGVVVPESSLDVHRQDVPDQDGA